MPLQEPSSTRSALKRVIMAMIGGARIVGRLRAAVASAVLAALMATCSIGDASAAWKCTAYGKDGKYGWSDGNDKGSAAAGALAACLLYGGGPQCKITNCTGSDPIKPKAPVQAKPPVLYCGDGRQAPPNGICLCPNGQRMQPNGYCPPTIRKCPNGENMPANGVCLCPNGQRMQANGYCPPAIRYCPNGQQMPPNGVCRCPDGRPMPTNGACPVVAPRCPNGQPMPPNGVCPGIRVPVIPPMPVSPQPPHSPQAINASCDPNPSLGLPHMRALDRSLYEITIGNTSLYAGGYANVAPDRNSCTGTTPNGCHLRIVSVPRASGGSTPVCLQFCKIELCPKAAPPIDANSGKPALKSVLARPYIEPQVPGKAPIKAVVARPFVEPQLPGKAPIKSVVARPYIEPQVPGKPSMKSVVSKPYVEGSIAPIGPPRQPQQ